MSTNDDRKKKALKATDDELAKTKTKDKVLAEAKRLGLKAKAVKLSDGRIKITIRV